MFVFHRWIKLGADHNKACEKKDIDIPCRIDGIGNEIWFAKMVGPGNIRPLYLYRYRTRQKL